MQFDCLSHIPSAPFLSLEGAFLAFALIIKKDFDLLFGPAWLMVLVECICYVMSTLLSKRLHYLIDLDLDVNHEIDPPYFFFLFCFAGIAVPLILFSFE